MIGNQKGTYLKINDSLVGDKLQSESLASQGGGEYLNSQKQYEDYND